MSDHAAHHVPGPNGAPIFTPAPGCAECAEQLAAGSALHRSDLARDAARAWRAFQAACIPVEGDHTEASFLRFGAAWEECGAALDRLAAAYLPDATPPTGDRKAPHMTG